MPPIDSTLAPKLKAPPGACDTHMHVYDSRYPTAPTAKFVPPDASVAAYRKMCARLGIERTVVVQPSTYGKDNRCTLEAVAAIDPNARCIVVVDESVTDAELDRLTGLGARGIRFFMLPGAPLPWEILETMSAAVRVARAVATRRPQSPRAGACAQAPDQHAGDRSRGKIP